MPTGYTAGVGDGKVTSFKEFAMTCARAFGACVELREEPLSPDIPMFKVDGHYHLEVLKAAQERDEFKAMPTEDRRKLYEAEEAKRLEQNASDFAKKTAVLERYDAMLRKARAFVPPTIDHEGLKNFMIEQLEESIRFDDTREFISRRMSQEPFTAWESKRVERLAEQVAIRKKMLAEEEERVANRSEWVRQLRIALDAVETEATT